jgi:lipoyl(octanoyl) transferase
MRSDLWCVRCGQVPYEEARHAQKRIEAARQAEEIPDVLLLLEHPPVYTKGRRTEPGELGMGEDWYRMQGIEVCETDRGGRVTYHGPGQLVGYPIVSLRAEVIEGLTGVWVGGGPPEGRKIGSIGVHVNRGVTTHGFAVNVNNDLQPFEWVVPCGIEGVRMTSVCRELGAAQDLAAYMDVVIERFGGIFERTGVELAPAELAERVAGVEALAAGPVAGHLSGNGEPASVR